LQLPVGAETTEAETTQVDHNRDEQDSANASGRLSAVRHPRIGERCERQVLKSEQGISAIRDRLAPKKWKTN
jgi:hypothetical protein